MDPSVQSSLPRGLVGTWSPGIGDSSLAGWLTVVLYVVTAWAVWRVVRGWPKARQSRAAHEQWFWRLLLVALVLLAINKQLDLQSAFTEIGRMVAHQGGWYKDRHQVQLAFIAGLSIMALTLLAATLVLIWGAPAATGWALAGAGGLVLFVVVRAASFHHVDAWLGASVAGFKMNWIFEMGSLTVILTSAWRRKGHH